MKKILITSMLFASLLSYADSFPTLVVKMKSGAEQAYTLRETIRVTMPDDSLHLDSEHINASFPLSSVSSFYFLNDEKNLDGIDEVTLAPSSSRLHFKREGNRLIISGLPKDSKLRVFSVNSTEHHPRITYSTQSDTQRTAVVDLATLPQGTYILSPSGSPSLPSLKFINL